MTPDVPEEDVVPQKRSSWSAALSQLPGFAAEGRASPPLKSRASTQEPECSAAPIESSPRTSAA